MELRLETPQHRILIDPAGASFTDWRPADNRGGYEPLSLAGNGEQGSRHFTLILTVDGQARPELVEGRHASSVTRTGNGLLAQFTSPASREGLRITKTFVIPDHGERLEFSLSLSNTGSEPVRIGDGEHGIGIVLGPGLGPVSNRYQGFAESLFSFVGLIYQPVDEAAPVRFRFEREEPGVTPHEDSAPLLWAGLENRYMLLAIGTPAGASLQGARLDVPPLLEQSFREQGVNPQYGSRLTAYTLPFTLAAGETKTLRFPVYAGAKDMPALTADPALDLGNVVFAGLWEWMRGLSFAILWLLQMLEKVSGSWGWAIILLAVVVRILLYPLARKAARQQKAFNEKQLQLRREIAQIKAAYQGGEQTELIFELYRRHGVSPFAGLKLLSVVLLQLPIFIALFHILGQSPSFRGAEFLWIDSLALPDELFVLPWSLPYFGRRFNLLPWLMALVSLAAMCYSGGADDSATQRLFILLMNLGFFALFYHFPAGMVLYWAMANLLHLGQLMAARGGKP